MLPLRFMRLREAACAFGFSVGNDESSRGFVMFRVFSIPGGVTASTPEDPGEAVTSRAEVRQRWTPLAGRRVPSRLLALRTEEPVPSTVRKPVPGAVLDSYPIGATVVDTMAENPVSKQVPPSTHGLTRSEVARQLGV